MAIKAELVRAEADLQWREDDSNRICATVLDVVTRICKSIRSRSEKSFDSSKKAYSAQKKAELRKTALA